MKVQVTLPEGVEIPTVRIVPLLKWFQKWVNPEIKSLGILREGMDYGTRKRLEIIKELIFAINCPYKAPEQKEEATELMFNLLNEIFLKEGI